MNHFILHLQVGPRPKQLRHTRVGSDEQVGLRTHAPCHAINYFAWRFGASANFVLLSLFISKFLAENQWGLSCIEQNQREKLTCRRGKEGRKE